MRIHDVIGSVRYRLICMAAAMLALSGSALAQFRVAITIAPPALPVYEQPVCPGDDYIWTPGYWAWDDDGDDYYWVPGTWVLAPDAGFFWTPPWWGWADGAYVFHEGWWGPEVGFYGGIDYGFGYFGAGFVGGRWEGGHFFYNRAVMNVNVVNIRNVYNDTTVIRSREVNRVSFNGGSGGIQARATEREEAAARGRHVGPVAAQTEHIQMARREPQLRASANQGRPPIAATDRPSAFTGHVVAAREAGAPYHAPARPENREARPSENRTNEARPTEARPNEARPNESRPSEGARPASAGHVKDLAPLERPAAPNTGNAAQDKKYQQQQEKLYNKQNQQRQQLQQRQEQEHQRATQQNYNQQRQQQMEQRHQQQTQQLQQRHQQQTQQLQQRQSAPPKRK
ncbi:MAG TPA: hypothetical protein VND65_13395 [Candidatus Binatia bacterium]|nr:hypothetical protein [Candidatus Binatia bacterium]